MNKNTNIIIGAVVVIVLIVILIVVASKDRSMEPAVAPTDSTVETTGTTTTSGTTPSTSSQNKSGASAGSAVTLSREEALEKYQDKLVRLTDECTGKPFTHSLNAVAGTVFMIDNDAKTSNTFVIEGRRVTVQAQRYTLEAINVDGRVTSICDPKTKVTTVSVITAAN